MNKKILMILVAIIFDTSILMAEESVEIKNDATANNPQIQTVNIEIQGASGKNKINVASVSFGREEKGGRAVSVWNVDSGVPKDLLDELKRAKNVEEVRLVKL